MAARADMNFAQYFDIPALGCGVSGANAHAPNEYVDLNSLFTLTKVLASFIVNWCGVKMS
jgi:acetylornithine deacetylase